MGSAVSRQGNEDAGVVFSKSTVPLSFSDRLANTLEGSKESEAAKALEIEAIVQERVAQELAKYKDSERKELARVTYELSKRNAEREQSAASKSKSSGSNTDLNSIILEGELAELKRQVSRRQPSASDKETTPDSPEVKSIDDAQTKLMSCLRTHRGKNLECQKELQNFQDALNKIQKQFVASLA
ncbi:hypothetical protein PYCC9005_005613 [Savitreella phatthalungensis]